MRKNFWLNLFLICVGVVVGTLAANLCAGIPMLSWLAYGMDFGMAAPATVDLQVISFTIGITLNLNISVIIFITLSVLLGNLIARK
ncbi:MAG: DUF4321 domain-containing protein [Ruminococcaceae bacterium]|nr:DUF4321 domain-containing protein [Oscillospiraceae bacterium]